MKKSALAAFAGLLMMASSAQALTVYSSVDEENATRILNAFTKATGVDVQMVFLSSGPALSRIEAEASRPQADVWFGAPSENHILANERNLTQPYVSANADGLAEQFKDANGNWHAIYTNPLAVGVRTDILESRGAPTPSSWEDLKNEAYRGLIQMPSPQSSGTAYAVILTLNELWGEDATFQYMKDLNPNIQTYTQSGTAPSGALGVGETPIALQFSPGFLKLVDEGFPVKVVFPSEGVGYEVAAMSILKDATNLDDAKKLVDWMTSAEGQGQLAAEKTYFLPIRSDVSAGEGIPSLDDIKLVSYDPAFASENRQRLVDRWVDEVLGQ
ncbi:ABC transporter substrate-binding protein [Aerobium aerolatum]|uniref:Iron(III) transport system substrate-binding protein n=1 Tax=Aquamicrobium aerolatum DSM 21857 TaxID=1121003 RepID=A0A1I3M0K0_9HYPH|nr:ABC transporter substrate-binding protein [Aquamicrobium aerolatum]SFI90534.1 iron(III) transport system substrate-binding protein [Aquamicrobium aerolatum DSM 21857]